MITLMIEAAFRSMALAAAVWTLLTALRLRPSLVRRWQWASVNPQVERVVWTMVLLGALGMPFMMKWQLPVFPGTAFTLPDITIGGLQRNPHGGWYVGLVLMYLCVALVLFTRFAIGFARLWRVRWDAIRIRECWTNGADVRVTSGVSSPLTFGSTILLPAAYTSWSISKRSVIVAHEISHARHRDCHIQWLAALHECLFWFSPLAWWLREQLRDLAEQASDDAVLRQNTDRADYAALLLQAANEQSASRIAMSIGHGRISRRIERILSIETPVRAASRSQRLAAMVLITPVIAFAAHAGHPEDAQGRDAGGSQTQQQTPGLSAIPPDTHQPYIVSAAAAGDLQKWYPEAAKRSGIEGLVQITVTVDEAGRATDTLVVSETPDGMGFGAAASALVHAFTYANPTGHSAALTFNVKFALDKRERSETTTFESASDNPTP